MLCYPSIVSDSHFFPLLFLLPAPPPSRFSLPSYLIMIAYLHLPCMLTLSSRHSYRHLFPPSAPNGNASPFILSDSPAFPPPPPPFRPYNINKIDNSSREFFFLFLVTTCIHFSVSIFSFLFSLFCYISSFSSCLPPLRKKNLIHL